MSGVPAREQVESLFEAALELDDARRADFVAAACRGDSAMRDAVMALLAAHARADGVLEGDPQAMMERSRIPQRLGPYRVLREVGRGGMGVVYDAERDDGQFRRRVAIKIIHSADDELQRRVLAERQILAALDHPHIARLLDGGVADDGRPYLVMEYVEGMPVDVYCDRMRLGVAERLRLFVTIARTVDFAHRNLVVHRDLKPSNVMVTPDGTVKLLDFGVAKLLNRSLGGDAATATRDRAALTPEYASPEQIQGGALTTTTDVYSLGVMLYELLCGRRPFAHIEHDLAAFMSAVCNDDIERPSTRVLREETLEREGTTLVPAQVARARDTTSSRLSRQLRGDGDAIVAAALRAEPPRRYGSAELLAQDIERHLAERPVRAHQGSRFYALRKLVRRHRVQAAAVLLTALSLVGGATVAAWQAARANRERVRAEAALAQSQEVTDFLLHLFEAGNPATVATGSITARDLVRRGAARIEELDGQPLLQARMLGVLGRIHESLGQYDEAQRLTQRALDIRRSLGAAADVESAGLMLQLGILQRRRAEFDSAQQSFTQARALVEATPGAPHMLYMQVLGQLYSIAVYRGDNVEAVRRAGEAVAVSRRLLGEHDLETLNAMRSLGATHWRRGEYAEAEAILRRVIELRPLSSSSSRHEALSDRLQLAELYRTLGRVDDAERLYVDVGRGLSLDVPEDVNYVVWSRAGHAATAEARGDLMLALRLRRQNLETRRQTLGDDHPIVAGMKTTMALTLARLQQFAEAERLFAEGEDLLVPQFGERTATHATLLADKARLRLEQRRLAEADSLITLALVIHGDRGLPLAVPYVERLMLRAEIQLALGQHAQTEELLNEALAVTRRAVAPNARPTMEIHELYERLYTEWARPAEAARHRAAAEGARRS